jgi:hypothetical protein
VNKEGSEMAWYRDTAITGWNGRGHTRLIKLDQGSLPPGVKEIHMHKTTDPDRIGDIFIKMEFDKSPTPVRREIKRGDDYDIPDIIKGMYEEAISKGYV